MLVEVEEEEGVVTGSRGGGSSSSAVALGEVDLLFDTARVLDLPLLVGFGATSSAPGDLVSTRRRRVEEEEVEEDLLLEWS